MHWNIGDSAAWVAAEGGENVSYTLYYWNGQMKWLKLMGYDYYLVDPAHVGEFRSLHPEARLMAVNVTEV